MQFAIHIPVRAHVKKYLVAQYGTEQIPLKKTDDIRLFLHNMIGKPGNRYRPKNLSDCSICFLLTEDQMERLGNSITAEHILSFNQFVEEKIRHELFVDILFATRVFDVKKDKAIADFMAVYGFDDDDIKHETLRKAFYRFEVEQNKKFIGKIVPSVTQSLQAEKSANAIRQSNYRKRLKQKKKKLAKLALKYAEPDV